MKKLVVLKLDGDLSDEVRASLEIGEDGKRPETESFCFLPKNTDLLAILDKWRSTYRRLDSSATRITPKGIVYDGSISNTRKECNDCATLLRKRLNEWLLTEPFRPLRENWLQQMKLSDEMRVLIRTDSMQLQHLPWQAWDLIEDYPLAEVALSAPSFRQVASLKMPTCRKQVRILAVLGDTTGIDVCKDEQVLKNLPGAKPTFLVKPQRQDLINQLWGQAWDILFFAGHSKTEENTGRIHINQTDSLTITELSHALTTAVAKGLQMAIFNSCDGMGLARELQELQIPQLIIMREPVPDQVAQAFLTHFLAAFANGKSFYLAEREARLKLQGLEEKFPCATWLPVIFQHPSALPPVWKEWCGTSKYNSAISSAEPQNQPPLSNRRRLQTALLASVFVTVLVMGVRYLGLLQSLELQAFDQLVRLRPSEQPDHRFLIVAVTEDDLQLPEQKQRIGSLSDRSLALLLQKLKQFKPRVIGLDIWHDFPVDNKQTNLAEQIRRDDNFFAICKVDDPDVNNPGIKPPPEVPLERLGFSDTVQDSDGILRRHLIAMRPGATSPCTTPYALSAQLAFNYLKTLGISAKYTQKQDLQIGNVVFKRLRAHTGGYQQLADWGYQILLNYRSFGSPLKVADQVTLKDMLAGKINSDDVKDRIVLIGVTAPSFHDYVPTPYSTNHGYRQEIPGVVAQAQMTSQLISAVQDGRPLLWAWPFWGDALWVCGWSLLGGVVVWIFRVPLYLGLAIAAGEVCLCGLCFLFLFQSGCWVPLIPSALALVATSGGVLAVYSSRSQFLH